MFQKTYFFTFPYLFSSKQILNNKKIFTFQLKKIQKNNLKNYVNKQKIYMRERERERERERLCLGVVELVVINLTIQISIHLI